MTAPKPPSRGGKIVIWFMIAFIALISVGSGTTLITEGLDGRDALADGPVGALTPTDRRCGKDSCSWTGEFVSEDGTIIRTGVDLHDAERIRRSDPMPTSIDNVRLHNDADRPTAYTIDYNPGPKIAGGVFLLAFCLAVAVLLVWITRRYTRRGPSPRAARRPARDTDLE